jgi:hypothetical protein
MIATALSDIARKRREAEACPPLDVVHDEGEEPDTGPGDAVLEAQEPA